MNSQHQFLTSKEVAQLCRVSPRTVENWRRRCQGPEYEKSETGRVLYPLDEVLRFISGYQSKIVCQKDDRSISQ
ncbi:MAG: hypothetical protein DELT_00474 [Desulfovibrio sp.]